MKKTTSENLLKRLSQYGALTAAVAGVASANGQIIYHDINPDFDGSSDYFLNLNPVDGITPGGIADGIDDFRIFESGSYPFFGSIKIELFNNNSVIASSSLFTYPFALNSGNIISIGNSNWNNQQFQTLAYASSIAGCLYGNWCNETDKFIGLKFDISGNTHYGWVQLDVNASTLTWSVKGYAFNSTPNQLIEAGQTVLGIDNNQFSQVKIVALNKSIALYNLPQRTDYKLFNMSGQNVLDGNIESQTHVIEAVTLAKGIYIIELQDSDTKAVIRKKIVL